MSAAFGPEKMREAEARLGAADYIAELSGELAAMARLHGLDTLSYVLEMARLEAQQTAHATRAAPPA